LRELSGSMSKIGIPALEHSTWMCCFDRHVCTDLDGPFLKHPTRSKTCHLNIITRSSPLISRPHRPQPNLRKQSSSQGNRPMRSILHHFACPNYPPSTNHSHPILPFYLLRCSYGTRTSSLHSPHFVYCPFISAYMLSSKAMLSASSNKSWCSVAQGCSFCSRSIICAIIDRQAGDKALVSRLPHRSGIEVSHSGGCLEIQHPPRREAGSKGSATLTSVKVWQDQFHRAARHYDKISCINQVGRLCQIYGC
jgi:hypothetical protein